MPLSPEQEALCERLEKGESTPTAAMLIRQQAREIDDLWDRLSRAYALVRQTLAAEMIQDEMEALRAMLDERRSSQLKKSGTPLILRPTGLGSGIEKGPTGLHQYAADERLAAFTRPVAVPTICAGIGRG